MGLTNRDIDFITDSSIFKQGKFTPMSRIPIKPDHAISNLKRPLIIILVGILKTILKILYFPLILIVSFMNNIVYNVLKIMRKILLF